MNWQTEMSFGKYKGVNLLTVLIKDKDYLKWCFESEMQYRYSELAFIADNIKEREKVALGL